MEHSTCTRKHLGSGFTGKILLYQYLECCTIGGGAGAAGGGNPAGVACATGAR